MVCAFLQSLPFLPFPGPEKPPVITARGQSSSFFLKCERVPWGSDQEVDWCSPRDTSLQGLWDQQGLLMRVGMGWGVPGSPEGWQLRSARVA